MIKLYLNSDRTLDFHPEF